MNTKILWVIITVMVAILWFFGVIPSPAFLGGLLFLVAFATYKSVYSPKEGISQIITLWGTKFWTPIKNSRKFKLNGWEVEEEVEKGGLNLYLYLWPIFDLHWYPLSYNKRIFDGTQRYGDQTLYTVGEEVIVKRTSLSNHLRFTEEYPIVTRNVRTKDGGVFNLLTTHVIRLKNVYLPLAETSNWLNLVQNKIDATILSIVAELTTLELITLKSDAQQLVSTFTEKMKLVNMGSDQDNNDGIEEILGMRVINSALNGFEGANEATKALLVSLTAEQTAKNLGLATIATGKSEGDAEEQKATGVTRAFLMKQQAEIDMARERMLNLGLLEPIMKGRKIVGYRQVAEINSQTWAKAFKGTGVQFLSLDAKGFESITAAVLSAKGGQNGN